MKVYRLRLVKLLLLGFIVANLVFFYYTWHTLLWRRLGRALAGGVADYEAAGQAKLDGGHGAKLSPKDKLRNANKHIRKSITIVFYGHYNFEQDLRPSIERYLQISVTYLLAQLVIVCGVAIGALQLECCLLLRASLIAAIAIRSKKCCILCSAAVNCCCIILFAASPTLF